MIVGVREVCPTCNSFVGARILLGMSSGLGPTIYTCSHCGTPVATDRREWNEMGQWTNTQNVGRLRYLIVSLVYMVLLGFVGGAFVGTSIRFVTLGPNAPEVPLSDYAAYWPYSVLIAAAIGGVQAIRVWISQKRSHCVPAPEYRTSFFSVYTNFQMLVLFAFLAPVGVCWLIGAALHAK